MKIAAVFMIVAAIASPCFAQTPALAEMSAANCQMVAGPGAPPLNALRVVGGDDAQGRSLFGAHEIVIIGGGSAQGLNVGDRFFVRRSMDWDARKVDGPVHSVNTTGGLHITAVNETTAMAVIDFMCDGIVPTDFLVPYQAPAVVTAAAATGDPDFTIMGHVVTGSSDHDVAGAGEVVITDLGASRGAQVGTRLAVFRDMGVNGSPLQAVGEAVVVATEPDTSIVRLIGTRDAVYTGDLLVPRK
ncbi:MAG TPA: hypothetical protein VHZ73_11570 [Vicinamibacterales bacterium]|jgi:hypothetical protein|nr:hypothetical protein [Vicinamibacterales bacterium]